MIQKLSDICTPTISKFCSMKILGIIANYMKREIPKDLIEKSMLFS